MSCHFSCFRAEYFFEFTVSFSRQRSSAHTVRRQTPQAIARSANLFETDCRNPRPAHSEPAPIALHAQHYSMKSSQSSYSSTRRALHSPRPANIGLRNDARRKLECRDWISLSSTIALTSSIMQYSVLEVRGFS